MNHFTLGYLNYDIGLFNFKNVIMMQIMMKIWWRTDVIWTDDEVGRLDLNRTKIGWMNWELIVERVDNWID